MSEVSQIKVAVPRMRPRGHRHGDPAPRRRGHVRRLPAGDRRGSTPGRCGWPTAPTRCTAAWSPGSSCGVPVTSVCLRTAHAVRAHAASAGAGHRRRPRARRGARPLRSGTAATRCWPPTSTGEVDLPPRRHQRRRLGGGRRATSSETWGGLDVLVNNAGVAGGGRLDVASLDEWRWITDINLFGVVRGTRAFVPMLKAQALRPRRQRRLAGRAGPPRRHGELQRRQGRRRRAHRDDRPRARRRTASGPAWSAPPTSAPGWSTGCAARTPRWAR